MLANITVSAIIVAMTIVVCYAFSETPSILSWQVLPVFIVGISMAIGVLFV